MNKFWLIFLSVCTFTITASSCSNNNEEESANVENDDDMYEDDDYDKIEQLVFDSWIENNWPNLVGNRQPEGYYVEILSNDQDNSFPATNKTSCWVEYNITSRDLEGNVCHTRNETTAVQQGTFTLRTRYVPKKSYFSLYDYSLDDENYEADALTLALTSDELVIDGVPVALNPTVGSKFRLWMPSRLTDDGGNGAGGYAGQFSLSTGRPMVSEIEITNVVVNAEDNEKEVMDWFVDSQQNPTDWKFVDDRYADYIYINYNYTPNTQLNFLNTYNYTQLDYAANFDELDGMVNEALLNAFGEGIELSGDEDDLVDDNNCQLWYITRTMDGFIVDTNIEEVKELIYNTNLGKTSEDDGYSMSYTADIDGSAIKAFFYSIPKLEYGQWATVITSSLEAYDIEGVTGTSTTTEIPAYTSLIFQIYVEED